MRYALAAIMLAAYFSNPVNAQTLNPNIADYKDTSFNNCYAGSDIGKRFGVSNPVQLLGSISYVGPVMGPAGQTTTGWIREPLSLPITVTEAVDPDVTTCSLEVETTVNAGVDILGVSVNAQRSDVYRVNVRLLSRQQLSQVAEGGQQTRVWNSTSYAGQFRAAVGAAPTDIKDFFLFDTISKYLVQIERYRKQDGKISAGIGLFSGGAKYKRDDTFRGTRLLVAGDPVVLPRTRFAVVPTVLTNATVSQAATTPVGAAIAADRLNEIQASLQASASSAE